MRCWPVHAEPSACPGLRLAVIVVHLLVAMVPWAAGSAVVVALPLSLLALAGLPAGLAAIPGRDCRVAGIAWDGSGWTVRTVTGVVWPTAILAGSRVFQHVVFCRLSLQGRPCDWVLPRSAFSATDFRRLKAAVRCSTARGACDAC